MSPFLEEPRRSPWHWLLIGIVVLAVVVGLGLVVRQLRPAGSTEAAPAASQPAASPTPTEEWTLPVPGAVPGLDAVGGEEKILSRCLYKEQRADAPDARVYNVDADGKHIAALIYSEQWKLSCILDESVSLGVGINTQWMSSPVMQDMRSSGNAVNGFPGYDIVGGRLASNVAKVQVTLRGKTVDVPVVNHTYLVRFARTQDYPSSGRENDPQYVVRAFDAAGKEITTNDGTKTPDCTYDAEGNRLEYQPNPPVRPCVTASPWS